jgi:hypothetical protein
MRWMKSPSNNFYYVGASGTRVFLGRIGLQFNIKIPKELENKRFRLKLEVVN